MRVFETLALLAVYSIFILLSLELFSSEPSAEQPEALMQRQAIPPWITGSPETALFRKRAIEKSAAFNSGLEQLPSSLNGTEVPDGLSVDKNGDLVLTPQLRDVFDYFLSTLGEEGLDTITHRLRAYFANTLPATAAIEANRILEGYLAWKQNLKHISEAGGARLERLDLQDVQAQQQMERDSCNQYMERRVCTVFFARQHIREDYALARFALAGDDNLKVGQKEQRLAALTASLPDPLQQQISHTSRYQRLQRMTAQSDKDAMGDTELRQIRENLVGPAAANRLEQLDARREDFDQRMTQWLNQREALLNNPGLSRSDRQKQVDQLRQDHFSSRDQVRVKARERIADQT